MEIFFVYGLVLIFFIALPFVVVILMKEPARNPDANASQQASSRNMTRAASLTLDKIASYGLLGAIFALLFIVSIASQRGNNR